MAALAVAAVVPIGGLGWALFSGEETLAEDASDSIPAYMTQNAELGPERGVLVVTGSVADGLRYTVQRGDGVTLGEDEVLALTPPDPRLTEDIATLISEPTPAVIDALADAGDRVRRAARPCGRPGGCRARRDRRAGPGERGESRHPRLAPRARHRRGQRLQATRRGPAGCFSPLQAIGPADRRGAVRADPEGVSMSTPDPTPAARAGRRLAAAGPASRTSLVLAVVLPLVTLGALTATSGEPAALPAPVPPGDTALTSLQVVCPPPITDGDLSVSSARASGETLLRLGDERSSATVTKDRTTVVDLDTARRRRRARHARTGARGGPDRREECRGDLLCGSAAGLLVHRRGFGVAPLLGARAGQPRLRAGDRRRRDLRRQRSPARRRPAGGVGAGWHGHVDRPRRDRRPTAASSRCT